MTEVDHKAITAQIRTLQKELQEQKALEEKKLHQEQFKARQKRLHRKQKDLSQDELERLSFLASRVQQACLASIIDGRETILWSYPLEKEVRRYLEAQCGLLVEEAVKCGFNHSHRFKAIDESN